MESVTDSNKAAVVRFNREVIEHGDAAALSGLLDDAFVNHSALPGADRGPDGMLHSYFKILKPALSNMRVEICDQVAEGDKVTTRKRVRGVHTGDLLGIPATNRHMVIEVIEIVRLDGGKYVDYWAISNLATVLAPLRVL